MKLKLPFAVLGLSLVLAATGCAAASDADATSQDSAQTEEKAPVPDTAIPDAPIPNFRKVREGLYRGGHPDGAGLDYLKGLGVKTIVDLEVGDFIEAFPWDISHEVDAAKHRGITIIRKPMSAFEAAESDRFDTMMDEIQAILKDPANGPVYVHCKHGQDRTGLIIGLERVFNEQWKPADAYKEMETDGFHPFFLGLKEYFERKTGWEDD